MFAWKLDLASPLLSKSANSEVQVERQLQIYGFYAEAPGLQIQYC